ncbi:unnamed protein product [Leptosia nina]|uniref:UBA domain-containing protein n=1 Tax=Leptosia nina TaxID=320188 RepID=A0AAV1JXY2_9NEOP
MSLLKAILRAQSRSEGNYPSPPPEVSMVTRKKKKGRTEDQRHEIISKVDCGPPLYDPQRLTRKMPGFVNDVCHLYYDNLSMVIALQKARIKGKIDTHWNKLPPRSLLYYDQRLNAYKRIRRENKQIHRRILSARPRLHRASSLDRVWRSNKLSIMHSAQRKFILFPLKTEEMIEDPAFVTPDGVKRVRVYLTLQIRNAAEMGCISIELFTEICPQTCALFLDLLDGDGVGYGYVGTRFFSPEGQVFTAYFAEDTLIEELKNRSMDFFYPNGENSSSRFKIVRVSDTATLHDFLTLSQEQVAMYDELLLIERRTPEAGTLWDLGAVRAPQPSAIAAATASLPSPQNPMRQPNLQSLLSTNELSYELRKILISLIEAGARLAAAGRNYELTLAQLSAALDEPQRNQQFTVQVITPEEIAARFNSAEDGNTSMASNSDETYRRAEHLQMFLEKFRAWRMKIMDPPNPESLLALKNLGFSLEDAETALRYTGSNVPAAASWLIGERGSSVFELINGLPDGHILQTLLKQPQIQRGLLNTRMLIAFIAMVGQTGSASLWLNSPHGNPLLSQISRTYHSEKYCLAVNQFSEEKRETPSTSRQR